MICYRCDNAHDIEQALMIYVEQELCELILLKATIRPSTLAHCSGKTDIVLTIIRKHGRKCRVKSEPIFFGL